MSTIITSSALSDRAMSSWPISIGTALALETLSLGPNPPYDPERPIPKGTDITRYDSFWINLKTLYRNILSALPSQSQEGVMAGECLYALEYEVETIREIITTISRGAITPTFYSTNYDGVEKEHPHAQLRVLTTPKQLSYHAQESIVIQEFHKRHDEKEGVHYVKRSIVPTTPSRGILMSHSAYDILSSTYFQELVLLESHTGIVKGRDLWHTKFQADKDTNAIPYSVATLQVFGDSILFKPFNVKQRQELIDISAHRNWSPVTTAARVKLGCMDIKDLAFRTIVEDMLKESI